MDVSVDGGNHFVTVYGTSTVLAGNGYDTIIAHGNAFIEVGNGGDRIQVIKAQGTVIAGDGNDRISVSGGTPYGTADYVTVGSGNDYVLVGGRGNIVVGAGKDTITLLGSGHITQSSLSGLDSITVGGGNDTIYEAGHASVSGDYGSATVFGGTLEFINQGGLHEMAALGGSATLVGGGLSNEFVGGKGDVVMQGGVGADTFIGGSGLDTMTGGQNSNLFEFLKADKGGTTVITNFVSGQDKLYLEGHSLSYLENHHDITTADGNTYIKLDGGQTTIELSNFTGLKSSDITHKP